MRITDEHGTHGFYDVSRYPPSQPLPHCAFPWLLDKLRWTQAIVTAGSHYLVQNRVRILRTGQHTPTSSTPRETWSLVASLPVSTHLLMIRCFNALWSFQHHLFWIKKNLILCLPLISIKLKMAFCLHYPMTIHGRTQKATFWGKGEYSVS